MKTAYHFLKDDMHGGYGTEAPWQIGEERDIGNNNLALCARGYHSSPSWYDALDYARGSMACIVEVSKPVGKDDTKQVSRKRRLIYAQNAEKVLRYWACDCAERALRKAKVTDERSWNAIKVARLYNEGKATKEELAAARVAAWAATRAARDAAGAAWVAAWAATRAARDAAGAAWDAAGAAWVAAWAATRAARDAAGAAARAAARDAEIKWQKRRLNKYMKELFQI